MSAFVVPITLASSADYAAWTGAASPSGIDLKLRACSTLVLNATKLAVYDTDEATGLATDTTTKNALRDATCIQAQAWVALNIDPATGGVLTSTVKRRKEIGSAKIEYADTDAAAAARAAAYRALVPAARDFLAQRGLIGMVGHS